MDIAITAQRFGGRRALITGGASGIGLATAWRLAREGAAIAVLDARHNAAEEAAAALRIAGHTAIGVQCDVGDEASTAAAVARTRAELGGIDVVVASAGIARTGATHALSLEEWETVIRVNLTGAFLTVKHTLPALIDGGGGAIVTIGSVASLVAAGAACSYDASKGGVLQLTRAVAVEYVDNGIRANCVCPGITSTGLRANSIGLYGEQEKASTSEASSRIRVPMQRRAEPEEVAAVVVFLCSDDASFVTGAAYAVDGGYTTV